jgi:hypothetical protein
VAGTLTLSSSSLSRNVSVSGQVVVPNLNATPVSLGNFTTVPGSASAAQSFQASGANLSSSIAIEAPAGFEVSLDNTNFTSNLTLGQSGGTANSTVYARIAAGNPVSQLSGNITLSSPGAATQIVSLAGVVLDSILSVTPASLGNFTTITGNASEAQFFTVNGSSLSASVSITAPAGFEIAAGNGTFGPNATISPSGGIVMETIHVRIASGAAIGPVSGNITVGSLGAVPKTVNLSGIVLTEYDAGVQAGVSMVVANPANYGLYTLQQYEANREAGRGEVTSNPSSFGLYTTDAILDMNLGGLMIQSAGGGNATLRLQLQSTPDLATQPFQNHGVPIQIPVQMGGTKGFLRVRAVGPQ